MPIKPDSSTLHFQPRRALGRTGFVATALGIGDLADRRVPLEQCVATVRRGMDAGLNVIDTAPGYEDGYSEQIVGEALQGSRDRMFVIDKIDFVDRPVGPQLEQSLARLRIENVDLCVLHGLSSMEGWQRAREPGGTMDELQACIRSGKTRFRGISSHDPQVLAEAIPSGMVDVVMFPIGPYIDARYLDVVLPLARSYDVGTICFKTFGAGKLLGDTSGYNQPLADRPRGKISSGGGAPVAVLPRLSVSDCLHYTLTMDPDVALLGLSFPNEQDAAFAAFREFHGPLSAGQMSDIRDRAAKAIEGKGKIWWNPV